MSNNSALQNSRPYEVGTAPAYSQQQQSAPQSGLATMMNTLTPEAVAKVAETLGQIQIAKAYPRDIRKVTQTIEGTFSRPRLAYNAMYTYARGGNEISALNIRSAEALANSMENFTFGFKTDDDYQRHYSSVVTYAWDIERNQKAQREFIVRHERVTKKGSIILTDPRDIYELVANQAQRRVRACILQLVPADLQDLALETIQRTIETNLQLNNQKIDALMQAFKNYGVNRWMLEEYLQGRDIYSMRPDQYMKLIGMGESLRDHIATVEELGFNMELSDAAQAAAQQTEAPKQEETKAAPAPKQKEPEQPAQAEAPAETPQDVLDELWALGK